MRSPLVDMFSESGDEHETSPEHGDNLIAGSELNNGVELVPSSNQTNIDSIITVTSPDLDAPFKKRFPYSTSAPDEKKPEGKESEKSPPSNNLMIPGQNGDGQEFQTAYFETTLRNLSTGFLDTTETTVYSTVELKEPQFNRVFAEAAVLLDNKDDVQGDGVDEAATSKPASEKLGWITGVYNRCLLNIFGVIMYLRVGWMVGQAGIVQGLIIVAIATVVTTITTLSMSAICTNGQVLGGGAYFMISRTLGPTVGSAVGILFSIGQAIAATMYNIGFVETTLTVAGGSIMTGDELWDMRILSIILLTLQLGVALAGMDWIVKVESFLLVIIVVSIVLLFSGFFATQDEGKLIYGTKFTDFGDNIGSDYTESEGVEYNFFKTLSIFFPAVTGIMAGANISGELKDPGYSIPKGTLYSIFTSWVVYSALVILSGATLGRGSEDDENGMHGNFLIYQDVCVLGPIIIVGIYGATLSSALASLVGAPRILQAVAADGILPIEYFAKLEENGDPVRGYYLSYAIGVACSLIGSLNLVAPIITMFFMITYAIINFAVWAQDYAKVPGWRPAFPYYYKWVSFFGGVLCVFMMFLMDYINALVSCFVVAAIMWYVSNKPGDVEMEWGTFSSNVVEQNVIRDLYRLRHKPHVGKAYRPNFLILTGDATKRPHLVHFAQCLRKGRGFTIFGGVYVGSYTEYWNKNRNKTGYLEAEEFKNCDGVYETVCADTFRQGVHMLVQSTGVGYMRPNAVILGYRKFSTCLEANRNFQKRPRYSDVVKDILLMKQSLIVAKGIENFDYTDLTKPVCEKPILQVWWLVDEGGFELLIPHILKRHRFFGSGTILELKVLGDSDDAGLVTRFHKLKALVKELRLNYECDLIDVESTKEPEKYFKKLEEIHPEFSYKNASRDTINGLTKWFHVAEQMDIAEAERPATIKFVTLPLPSSRYERDTWHALLEILGGDKTATLFVRGNHQNALTTDL